jgi:hypothetical protein
METEAFKSQSERDNVEGTNYSKQRQIIIFALFVLALISLGVFILLRLLLEQTP